VHLLELALLATNRGHIRDHLAAVLKMSLRVLLKAPLCFVALNGYIKMELTENTEPRVRICGLNSANRKAVGDIGKSTVVK
jgi:hypothetical protein